MTSMSAAISANERTMIATSSSLIWTPANWSCLSGTMSDGKRRLSAPNTPCTALLKKIAMPMVAIIGIRCGALRLRKGRSTSTSITSPSRPLASNATNSATQSGAARCVTTASAA